MVFLFWESAMPQLYVCASIQNYSTNTARNKDNFHNFEGNKKDNCR